MDIIVKDLIKQGNNHGTCVAMKSRGLLIIGRSGSGKSAVALALLGLGCDLVCDDCVCLSVEKGDGKIGTNGCDNCHATRYGKTDDRGTGDRFIKRPPDSLDRQNPPNSRCGYGLRQRLPPATREYATLQNSVQNGGQTARIDLIRGANQPNLHFALLQYLIHGRGG